ncbi:MAG: twin-arginine translocation signal domain-containing protein, partial [Gaiellaceae bacterium]
MNRPLTRRDLLQRAALGGAALTLPGFLAACGGDDTGAVATTATGGGEQKLASNLRFANWQ